MKKVEMVVECPSCEGTGLYSGVGESKNVAIICHRCDGTGAFNYSYSYNEFTKRKIKDGIERVYLKGTRYKLSLGKVNFDGVGEIDMDKEGVSYSEFLDGKKPEHIRKLECPLLADQSACHKIKGFVEECDEYGVGWGDSITNCKNQHNKHECWGRLVKNTNNKINA
jgi:hypothetical protein